MKKIFLPLLVVSLLVIGAGIGAVVANDPGIKASKATIKVSELTLIEWSPDDPLTFDNDGDGLFDEDPVDGIDNDEDGEIDEDDVEIYDSGWQEILKQNIKTPNQKDLFIDVSLETGLYTLTHVKSKRNYEGDPDWDTSTAHAKIMVRVQVDDGVYATVDPGIEQQPGVAFPRCVTFNEREQTLSAKFMGIFTGDCLIVTEDEYGEHTVTIDYECLEPEELELILNTMSANSFNFVVADLEPGNHWITVEAKIIANGAAEEGKFEAQGLIGQGTVVIELVRMVKGEDYLELE